MDDLKLKVYAILSSHLPGDFVPPTEEAKSYVSENLLSAVNKEGNSCKLGFVIIHYSKGQNWLLLHWWAQEDICCQIMAHSKEYPIKFSSINHRPIHACIWENMIINHENKAWIKLMLNENPNSIDYLKDRFADGWY